MYVNRNKWRRQNFDSLSPDFLRQYLSQLHERCLESRGVNMPFHYIILFVGTH